MESIVNVTGEDIYGSEERSPEFNNQIVVKFACDISAGNRKRIRELNEKLESASEADKPGIVTKQIDLMIKAFVLDWNLGDEAGNKLEISAKTLDERLSAKLAGWISQQVMSFLALITSKPKD